MVNVANSITAENRSSSHFMGSLGIDFSLGDKFGFYIETNYMSAFGDDGISHFAHGIGFSYGLSINDKDKDGIPDRFDECQLVPGIEAFNGCPDSDGDGIPDKDDDCPDIAGTFDLNGCLDTDFDGIIDSEDDCPEAYGPQENDGCPLTDKDGDGIIDELDQCPEVVGPQENEGCPLLSEKELAQLNSFGAKLFFVAESAKLIGDMKERSIRSVIEFLQKNQKIRILIEGHTSSDGQKEYNLQLSSKRAENVRLRLIEEGIDPERLEFIGYGDTKPLYSNETIEGRSKNRRVEFKLIQKQ